MKKSYYVYFMSNDSNSVIYTGVTNNLISRVYSHKNKTNSKSFTAKYNINKLIYFEEFKSIIEAIQREKQIKAGSRKKKDELVNKFNPEWKDLYSEFF